MSRGLSPRDDVRLDGTGRNITMRPASVASLPGRREIPDPRAMAVLRELGHEYFRDGQVEIINALLKNEHVLACMATSSGKTLCFQIPAIVKYRNQHEITVVISPLISLIRDQIRQSGAMHIPVAYFDSIQSKQERDAETQKVRSGKAVLVYVSPERFVSAKFREDVLKSGNVNVGMVAIDEGHVITQWGKDFRRAYGVTLGKVINQDFPDSTIFVCTATAPEPIKADIIETLGLKDPYVLIGDLDRTNLRYSVVEAKDFNNKRYQLLKLASEQKRNDGTFRPMIVYCAKRSTTENVAAYLRKNGINAVHYHAGLPREERIKIQNDTMHNNVAVTVATCAFGMGINKPDVRVVAHMDIPGSLEQYSQESGRAGRDQNPSECIVLYDPKDLSQQLYFINASNPSREQIKRVFNTLWKYYLHAKAEGDPVSQKTRVVTVKWDNFFPSTGEYKRLATQRRSAVTSLVQYGAIEIDGTSVILKATPRTINRHLPSDREVQAKKHQAVQSLMKMIYYARQGMSDEVLRQTLMNHLRHDSITPKVTGLNIISMLGLKPNDFVTVLEHAGKRDINRNELVIAVNKLAIRAAKKTNVSHKAILPSKRDARALVDLATWTGMLRLHRRGSDTLVSLTAKGQQTLLEADTTNTKKEEHLKICLSSASYEDMKLRMGQHAEIVTLQNALRDWYENMVDAVRKVSELKERLRTSFMRTHFTVLDTQIEGRQLVADFYGISSEDVSPRHARNFLNYLFDDPIDLLASRKRLAKD